MKVYKHTFTSIIKQALDLAFYLMMPFFDIFLHPSVCGCQYILHFPLSPGGVRAFFNRLKFRIFMTTEYIAIYMWTENFGGSLPFY